MSQGMRRWAAVFAALAMIVTAAPAASRDYDERANAPAMVDVFILRPLGIGALALGTGLFVAISPIVLISRPHEMNKPFYALVTRPAQYVWVDPIGSH